MTENEFFETIQQQMLDETTLRLKEINELQERLLQVSELADLYKKAFEEAINYIEYVPTGKNGEIISCGMFGEDRERIKNFILDKIKGDK